MDPIVTGFHSGEKAANDRKNGSMIQFSAVHLCPQYVPNSHTFCQNPAKFTISICQL